MVFQRSLSDSKSPQVYRTLLSILVDLNNAVTLTISTRAIISKSSSSCTNPLVTVPRAPVTIIIIVTFMFHSFFSSLIRSRYLSLFLQSFNFTLWFTGTAKSTILPVLSFLLIIIRAVCLVEIRGSVCISKFQRSLCISFSRTDSWLCTYHLFVWSNFHFWHISQ